MSNIHVAPLPFAENLLLYQNRLEGNVENLFDTMKRLLTIAIDGNRFTGDIGKVIPFTESLREYPAGFLFWSFRSFILTLTQFQILTTFSLLLTTTPNPKNVTHTHPVWTVSGCEVRYEWIHWGLGNCSGSQERV